MKDTASKIKIKIFDEVKHVVAFGICRKADSSKLLLCASLSISLSSVQLQVTVGPDSWEIDFRAEITIDEKEDTTRKSSLSCLNNDTKDLLYLHLHCSVWQLGHLV